MSRFNRQLKISVLALWVMICLEPARIFGQTPDSDRSGVMWRQAYGDDSADYYATAMATAREDGVWLGGTTRRIADPEGGPSFWIWKVDAEGRRRQRIPLETGDSSTATDGAYPYFRSLIETRRGFLSAVVEFEVGHPYMVIADRQGRVVSVRSPQSLKGMAVVESLETANGDLVLVGRRNDVGRAVRLTPSGAPVWEKDFVRPGRGLVVDGIAGEQLWIVGNYGEYDSFGIGNSTLFVTALDEDGEVLDELAIAGRHGSLVRSAEGFLLVYDKSATSAQDIHAAALGRNLELLAETRLLTLDFGLTKFKIAACDEGRYLVAGTENAGLWTAWINERTEVLRTSRATADERIWTPDGLVSSGNQVFLLSSIMSVAPESQELSRDVGLAKLVP